MKRRKRDPKHLNKVAVIKTIIFILIIVLVEVATGIFCFDRFSKSTYKKEYDDYANRSAQIAEEVTSAHSAEISGIANDSALVDTILTEISAKTDFEYYVVFNEAQSGKIVASSGLIEGNLANYEIKLDKTAKFSLGDETYVFAPASLGGGYYIAGIADFTQSQKNISSLRDNVVAILVSSGAVIVAMFILYVFSLAERSKRYRFKYKLTIDSKTGKIKKKNSAFSNEFTSVSEFKNPQGLNRKGINLLNLSANFGEKLVALQVSPLGPNTKIYADDVVNAESFIQTSGGDELGDDGRSTGSLQKVYESFTLKGKRTLLGVLYISNLDQIKTLFGKQMALDIQRVVLKKAREKFTYAYDIDFAYIAITYPDGKKLDNLLSDMEVIHRYVANPIRMEDNLFTLGLKSGFALCDSNMKDLSFEHAYKAAEAARQRAIDTGIADYLVYNESQRKLYDKYFITFDIKQMLAEGAFEMEYQPQYNIKEERVEGFEALFRVKKSWNVNVDTFSFITYAERTGAMVQLGDFIFETGMQFAKKLEGRNITVSLNVSPVQLMQAGFTENFLRLFRKYGLQPGSICVEITESFLMTNFNETLQKLAVLTSNGIDVHLDDFGTEYSSLLYIKKLPITTIKIDKEFVKDVLTSKESQAIIRFITNIAKLLNRTTICEGVETPQEYDMLNYLGCDTIQGWVIGKSMKPDAALEFIDKFDYKKVVAAYNGKK